MTGPGKNPGEGASQAFQAMAAWSVLSVLFLTLSGCSGLQVPRDGNEALARRVNAFMAAKVAGRWDLAYTFLDPDFRKRTPLSAYLAIPGNTRVTAYRVESMNLTPDGGEARVTLRCSIDVTGVTFTGVPEHQRWTATGGSWYLGVESPALPPGIRKQAAPAP